MPAKPQLILFGRFPQYGVGKRRLAKGLGNLKAWQFSRSNVQKTLRNLHDPRWRLLFCATPDRWARTKKLRPQGLGDLGQRLARPFSKAKGRPVLIMGSDIPDVAKHDISLAFRHLRQASAVIGASEDGGFWCLGLRRRKVSPRLLNDIRWSCSTTREETVKRLERAGYQVSTLPQKDDIDDINAYATWKSKP